MSEPWFARVVADFLPLLIVGLPILIAGVTPGLFGYEVFERYATTLFAVTLTASVGGIVFGLVAKFLGQPSFVYFGFLMAGGIGTVMIIIAWYVMKQFD